MQHDKPESGQAGGETARQSVEPNATAAQAAATVAAEETGNPTISFDPGPEQLRAIVEALQAENDKIRSDLDAEKDQGLRLRAEVENIRKRAEREKADIAKYAISKFAGDVVNVADNFERALKSVPEEASADNPTLKALQEGVAMTEREFLKVLEKHGVRRIDPTGGPFNPHQHQAVMEQENADVPTGTVVQVFQSGYIIEDRVLRPAMVVVSRGGQKPARAADAAVEPPRAANDDAAPGAPQQGDGAGTA